MATLQKDHGQTELSWLPDGASLAVASGQSDESSLIDEYAPSSESGRERRFAQVLDRLAQASVEEAIASSDIRI